MTTALMPQAPAAAPAPAAALEDDGLAGRMTPAYIVACSSCQSSAIFTDGGHKLRLVAAITQAVQAGWRQWAGQWTCQGCRAAGKRR